MRDSRPGGERRAFLIFAAVLILVTVGIIVMMRPGSPERAVDNDGPSALDDVTTAEPTEKPKRKKKARADKSAGGDLPGGLGGSFPGLGIQPGMAGDSSIYSLPKHTITIRLSAPQALGLVAYVIPSSPDHSQGSHVEKSNSWSLTTTVYGNPDYAVVYLQAGPSGQPETCEISVDGRVTERQSTEGPYSTMWCQG